MGGVRLEQIFYFERIFLNRDWDRDRFSKELLNRLLREEASVSSVTVVGNGFVAIGYRGGEQDPACIIRRPIG